MEAVLINGVASAYASVEDRGLHYGDGLFETIACRGARPLFIDQHLQRMERGARILDIAFPGRALLRKDIDQLLKARRRQHSIIKLILTRGRGKRGYRYQAGQVPTRICMRSAWPTHVQRWARQGIGTRFCEMQVAVNPALAGIKTLNRLENVLASGELGSAYDEGFLSDLDGNVIEGTMSNLFAVIDDTLLTPDLSRCGIAGIMRAQIIDCAKACGMAVKITHLSKKDLLNSDGIFVSNSVIGLCIVNQLEQRRFRHSMMIETIREGLKVRIDSDAKNVA